LREQNKEQIETNSYNVETNSLQFSQAFYSSPYRSTEGLTMDNLQSYMRYPMIYNSILREISRQSYNMNGLYSNAINYMVSIPTLSYITINRNKEKSFKKKKTNFNNIVRLLNHEKTTRDIVRHMLIDGMYVGILRDTTATNKDIVPRSGMIESIQRLEGLSLDDNFMIQPLDLDYCKIVGFQNNVNIAAFDMMYFNQFNYSGFLNEIRNYPSDFLQAYLDYKDDASKSWYVLDYKTTIALKFSSDIDEAYGRPMGLAAFDDIKFDSDYTNSQYKLIQELASSIYYLILPQGEKAGSCAINNTQQTELREAFQNAVRINTTGTQAKISTITLPPNSSIDKVTKDSSLLKDTLSSENIKKISTSLGFASSALNAASEGAASYSSLAVNIDLVSSQVFQIVNEVACEYTRVINYLMGIKPNDFITLKYLPISWLNKTDMSTKAKELYLQGRGSLSFWIASSGFDVDDYISMMDMENEEDWDSKYVIHLTSYTARESDTMAGGSGGAPEKALGELSPSGEKTKTSGSNKSVKPSTSKK